MNDGTWTRASSVTPLFRPSMLGFTRGGFVNKDSRQRERRSAGRLALCVAAMGLLAATVPPLLTALQTDEPAQQVIVIVERCSNRPPGG